MPLGSISNYGISMPPEESCSLTFRTDKNQQTKGGKANKDHKSDESRKTQWVRVLIVRTEGHSTTDNA